MCWPLKNFKTVKYCDEIAARKAPRRLIVSSVAYFTAKNAPLDTTSCEVTKITVFWHLNKDFQEKDFYNVIRRPIRCSKQRHEKEELKYFCNNCTTAACQNCVSIDHAGHAIVYLDEEAEKQKIQMKSLIETKKSDLHVQGKINVLRQLDEDYVKMIQRGEDLKLEVHEFVSKRRKRRNKPFTKQ